jgi:succinate dehydrogenase flavin-adding protein (antitoxin of CptAB toxin-antitoxin module)
MAFGISNKEDKKNYAAILHDTDEAFLKWAMNKLLLGISYQ